MEIDLNGKKIESQCRTLAELISERELDTSSLVAEVNYSVIQQVNWQDTLLHDGDQVELLCFVGGG